MTPERWRRIDELFEGALKLDPAARESWLRGVCGDDEELRAEVGRLLAGDERADRHGFLRPPEWPARGPEPRTTDRTDPERPAEVDCLSPPPTPAQTGFSRSRTAPSLRLIP